MKFIINNYINKFGIKLFFVLGCFLTCLISNDVFAQDLIQCGTDGEHFERMQTDPDYAKKHNALEERVLDRTVNYYNSPLKSTGGVLTIPLVVHVVDDIENPQTSLTDQDIIDEIADLNLEYSDANGNSANTEIEFCLASFDPNGNPHSGITRVDWSTQYVPLCVNNGANMKATLNWDQTQYLNIWLVSDVSYIKHSDGLCNDLIAGYGRFPTNHGTVDDGIVVGEDYFDTSTLPHEIGHYLNLYHTFQNGCTNNDCLLQGDRVCDTPPDGSTFWVGCPYSISTCSTDVNPNDPNNPFTKDQNDMVENFMDYNDKPCRTIFTDGQKVRMRDALMNERASLLNSVGCCKDNLLLNSVITQDKDYEVSDYIETTETFLAGNVVYDAGNYIEFNPGFQMADIAEDNFICALIDGCGGAYRQAGNANGTVTNKPDNATDFKSKAMDSNLNSDKVTNYPNPFANTTTINYILEKDSKVSISVFDISGKEVARLVDNVELTTGFYQEHFDGSNLNAGVYFYTVQTEDYAITKKMVIHK